MKEKYEFIDVVPRQCIFCLHSNSLPIKGRINSAWMLRELLCENHISKPVTQIKDNEVRYCLALPASGVLDPLYTCMWDDEV